jgi:mannose-6-phosphate isomerase-like protein (cupin superfamily)
MKAINVQEKLSQFNDYWNPRVIGELNGQHVKLAKFFGEFIFHKHDEEDEMFYVIKGNLKMAYENGV